MPKEEAINAIDIFGLPNYEDDKRTDPKARVYCGQVSGGQDWLKEVALNFGAGAFVSRPRLASGKFGKEIVFFVPAEMIAQPVGSDDQDDDFADDELAFADDDDEVEDGSGIDADTLRTIERLHADKLELAVKVARLEAREAALREVRSATASAPAQPASTLNETLQALKTLDELREAKQPPPAKPEPDFFEQFRKFKEAERLFAPEPPAQNALPVLANEGTAGLVTALLNRLPDGEAGEDATANLLRVVLGVETNPVESKPTVMESFAMAFAENPALQTVVAGLLGALTNWLATPAQAQAQAATSHVPSFPQGQTVNVNAPISEPPPPAQAATAAPRPLQPQEAMQVIMQEMAANNDVERAANITHQLLPHPVYGQTLRVMLTQPPAQTIAQFEAGTGQALPPHAADWLGRLIEAVTGAPAPIADDDPNTPEGDTDDEDEAVQGTASAAV